MSEKFKRPSLVIVDVEYCSPSVPDIPKRTSGDNEQVYHIDELKKLGVTTAIFLIVNKIVGIGSEAFHITTALWDVD